MICFLSKCGKQVKIDDKYTARKKKCPKCQGAILVSQLADEEKLLVEISTTPENSKIFVEDNSKEAEIFIKLQELTRTCPYCGEIILEVAKKCKHCREFLVDTQNDSAIANNKHQGNTVYDSELIAVLMLTVPIISIFLIFFGLGNLAFKNSYQSVLSMITIGTVLLTAILAMVEAGELGFGKEKTGKRETGPAGWFLFFIVLWVIAYPSYLYKRSKYGLSNYCLVGILIALIFSSTSLLASFEDPFKFETRNTDVKGRNEAVFPAKEIKEKIKHWYEHKNYLFRHNKWGEYIQKQTVKKETLQMLKLPPKKQSKNLINIF